MTEDGKVVPSIIDWEGVSMKAGEGGGDSPVDLVFGQNIYRNSVWQGCNY